MARRHRDTSLPAPFLKRLSLKGDHADLPRGYPFDLPWLTEDFELEFEQPVSSFVGENGSGKSTLIEATAALAGFDEAGGGKVKVDWDAWCARSLADEDIVRLILDGTVIKTRLDRKATNISVLAAIGVRRDGQKVLLSIRNMGGESKAAWRQFLDDLDARGLKRPEFVIVDGAPGLHHERH